MSAEKAELGRHLFYSTELSQNRTQSCGSCHLQELAFTDGKAGAVGSTGQVHRRSSMALGNVGYASALTWSSDVVRTLEDQALLPIFGEDPVELGMAGQEVELIRRLEADATLRALFADAFPDAGSPVTLDHLLKSLATFQRTLITADAPYDRWQRGEQDLDPAAMRGMELFFSERLECFHCHGSFSFTDSVRTNQTVFDELAFHNTGLYNLDKDGAYPEKDRGLFELTGRAADMGRFRAPTLRNIELTAPYMHDGSVPSLDDVIDHYAAGGRTITDGPNAGVGSENLHKSEFVKGFVLEGTERDDLKAFLRALTDRTFLVDPRFSDPNVSAE
jgi:cytochrome c peroxidase